MVRSVVDHGFRFFFHFTGNTNLLPVIMSEFPLELCHQFQDGFPTNWGQLILPHILPQASVPLFMLKSNKAQAPSAQASSMLSSATLSTGTDYDYPAELTSSTATRSKVENEHTSPMSWRNQSSLSSSPHSIPMRNLVTEAAQNAACESDSCPGDYSNVSDTTYQTDGSKREASTSAGVQTFVPQTARNMDENGPFSQFSVHHIQANSVNYPHTPWGITYKTLKRRQDETSEVYFQLPARKRVVSGDIAGSDTSMNDFTSNNEVLYSSF